jgi:O-antigen ligase
VACSVAVSSVSKPRREQGLAAVVGSISPSAAVVAGALPLLFLHRAWQPTLTVSLGSVHPQAWLSDLAVVVVVIAALISGIRSGFAPLRAGRIAWIAWAAFAVWIAISIAYGSARFGAYPARTHAVTATKWIEYALLAPSLPLLLRRRRDLDVVLWSLALWSAAATLVGVLEFFGADVAAKGTIGHRQASFLGSSDFAALSAAALIAGAVMRRGWLARLLIVAGTIGTVVAGSLAAMLGLATALGALLLLHVRRDRRRSLALVSVLAAVAAGSLAIRVADLSAFQRFLGGKTDTSHPGKVETYAHHTLLVYIGGRIWLGHPLLGVGWQGSNDPFAFEPYLADAHKRFDNVSPKSFPAPGRIYGVQNAYVQALADLGVVGFAALLAVLGTALALALRARESRAGSIAALWVALVAWLWTAQGFIAGVPLDALVWLTVGLAATAAAWRRADG